MTDFVAAGVDRIRREAPLVHNVTNLVAMTLSANVLIAAGASPIMSAAPEEAGILAGFSGALVVNIGTLTRDWIEGAHAAVAGALAAGRPWVLDPVGVGATPFRRETADALIAQRPRIIRGNASEIMALAGSGSGGKGVDSTTGSDAAAESAARLARDDRSRDRGDRCGRSGDRRQPHADRGQRTRAAHAYHRVRLCPHRPDRGLGRRPRRSARGDGRCSRRLRGRRRAGGGPGVPGAAASSRHCSTPWARSTAPPRRDWRGSRETHASRSTCT